MQLVRARVRIQFYTAIHCADYTAEQRFKSPLKSKIYEIIEQLRGIQFGINLIVQNIIKV